MADQQLALLKMPELEKLEDKVRRGLASFVETGRALMEIQDKKGYLLRGHKTMEEYCEQEFHFSLRQGQRLMIAADTARKVEQTIGEAPRNEASARVLTQVASDPKLLGKLKDKLEKQKLSVATATAEKLQEVVDKIKPQTKSMFDDSAKERASAKVVAAAGLSDKCPACDKVPTVYRLVDQTTDGSAKAWKCGQCGATVRVSVLSVEIATCKECGAPVLDDAGICRKCGSVL